MYGATSCRWNDTNYLHFKYRFPVNYELKNENSQKRYLCLHWESLRSIPCERARVARVSISKTNNKYIYKVKCKFLPQAHLIWIEFWANSTSRHSVILNSVTVQFTKLTHTHTRENGHIKQILAKRISIEMLQTEPRHKSDSIKSIHFFPNQKIKLTTVFNLRSYDHIVSFCGCPVREREREKKPDEKK